METVETVSAADRAAWRAWLETNHHTCKCIWLVYFKRGSGEASVSYEEAVQEAICFGWIDGQVRSLDHQRYMQRYTPRTAKSRWSAPNVKRAELMITQGRMTEWGLQVYREGMTREIVPSSGDHTVPPELTAALADNPTARGHYEAFPPSARLMYAYWVNDAKTEATRARRLAATLAALEQNLRYGEKQARAPKRRTT